jgi:hypothetical protein
MDSLERKPLELRRAAVAVSGKIRHPLVPQRVWADMGIAAESLHERRERTMTTQLDLFASLDGDRTTAERDGFTFTAEIVPDSDHGTPWDNEDGHGPVTGWERRSKAPGELVLIEDHKAKQFYDFAEAVRIARRDGWGPAPYQIHVERGANGLMRCNAQWYEGRQLLAYRSAWHDEECAARADVYHQHRSAIGPGAYAAAAARADFERLQAWCNDGWSYVGVVVTVEREGVELGRASLWGIESDAGDYLCEVANELAEEALGEAVATIGKLAAAVEAE